MVGCAEHVPDTTATPIQLGPGSTTLLICGPAAHARPLTAVGLLWQAQWLAYSTAQASLQAAVGVPHTKQLLLPLMPLTVRRARPRR